MSLAFLHHHVLLTLARSLVTLAILVYCLVHSPLFGPTHRPKMHTQVLTKLSHLPEQIRCKKKRTIEQNTWRVQTKSNLEQRKRRQKQTTKSEKKKKGDFVHHNSYPFTSYLHSPTHPHPPATPIHAREPGALFHNPRHADPSLYLCLPPS